MQADLARHKKDIKKHKSQVIKLSKEIKGYFEIGNSPLMV
jgi:hypothetical protein